MTVTPPSINATWRSVLDTVVSVAMLVASGLIIYSYLAPGKPAGTQGVVLPKQPLSIDGAFVRGNKAAPVGIIAFSDFQCPYCARFATEVMPSLVQEYIAPGKAFLAFRHLPLERIHPQALKAAEAAGAGKASFGRHTIDCSLSRPG